jgi:hypothetical protein
MGHELERLRPYHGIPLNEDNQPIEETWATRYDGRDWPGVLAARPHP